MNNIPFLDLNKQYESIKQEIDNAISDVISDMAFIKGPYVKKFEEAFAKFTNAKHCIGVGNGTDALYIALKALNIGSGDEVITAANTFIATAEAITMTGADVKFVDINPKTYNIDVQKIEEKITSNTKAIIAVHIYGQPADMDPIIDLARKYNLKIIEDAAQAHGAVYKGKTIGMIGDIGCFSFYPGKNLGAYGDGGALVMNDDDLALKVRMYADHGRISKYDHSIQGMNSRLDGLQAAILNVKLKYLSQWNEQRRKNAYLYNEFLKDTNLILPYEYPDVYAVYHLYIVRIKVGKREQFQKYLRENGIATGIHYPIALPYLKAYAYLKHTTDDFPEALKASTEIVSLPLFPELRIEQISYIADHIKKYLSKY